MNRINFEKVHGVDQVMTPEFIEYLLVLHDHFSPLIHDIRHSRMEMLSKSLENISLPDDNTDFKTLSSNWQVAPVPDELRKPGIEISGPSSITSMFINALNPGPEGVRAEGDLDDDEDASGHRFSDTVTSAINRLGAVNRTLNYTNNQTGKKYSIKEGEIPFFMHRERGLHLDEHSVMIDGKPISASILGTALTIFHAGQAQINKGQGVYFYLPKMELLEEANLWKNFFDLSIDHLKLPSHTVIKAIPLIESLPAVYRMDGFLNALGPYAAGLNAARWDLKASIFEYTMTNEKGVWPDRFDVDIKTTPFIANIFRRLVATCLNRNAVPIGGMATALPSKNEEVNLMASNSIKEDKEWEAQQGFIRAWVAHIYHMKTAGDPFKNLNPSKLNISEQRQDPNNYPVQIDVPNGNITLEGTRRNARMLIEYLEGWLNGRGAKGIDSLEGKSGNRPALMEDLATGRMSVAQIAQRILHQVRDSDSGHIHTFDIVKQLLKGEVEDIVERRTTEMSRSGIKPSSINEMSIRYQKAFKISLQWINNYVNLNFRSLGSYTRKDLGVIAEKEEAF
ncbi:MAG: hypothetical protein FI728_03845 [SAR202 cluster bacterium]|nr:hypothetical protein [SAR202 cluster bacterium]|tara:strand:- start:3067 stop:4761 length:1695 start_codon:yes stop_codon:yes gene_type:complete